jgi:hypothetical protein
MLNKDIKYVDIRVKVPAEFKAHYQEIANKRNATLSDTCFEALSRQKDNIHAPESDRIAEQVAAKLQHQISEIKNDVAQLIKIIEPLKALIKLFEEQL